MTTTTNSNPVQGTQATGLQAGRRSIGAALASGVLGLAIVWAVGFSHIEAAHNAAHDTRHSFVFPCH